MPGSQAKQQRSRISLERASDREFARHILTFDSDRPETYSTRTIPPPAVMRSTARSPIPWPAGQAPTPSPINPAPNPSAALSQYDYLVVTWTEEEGKCLADTLTSGYPSETAWYHYTHNFQTDYVPIIRPGAPALESKRLGSYFPTTISGKRVLCFKSELHFSQDGPKMPIAKLWAQLIQEVKPKLVITTGTAGGIGSAIELGDVVAAQAVRFDCTKAFKSQPFHNSVYQCSKLKNNSFAQAQRLFAANASHLPVSTRPPQIFSKPAAGVKIDDVVTTDFFAYDDSDNTFGLQSLGAAVEMGDAVLGLVIKQLGSSAPAWTAVRNASDPQINDQGLTPAEARAKAGQIYEKFGYWTTISSAIACWALVLDN
jgi:purine-nucleoside phosphorylase